MVLMSSGEYEKPKKKKKVDEEIKGITKKEIDDIWDENEGKLDYQRMEKEVKEDDKDDTASLGDEKGVQSGGVPLSPKERLSGRGRIHRYIRSRV